MNPHWGVQTVHLPWNHISYDFVGRIDNFDSDLDRLGEFLGIDLRRHFDVRSKHKTVISEYYTPQLQERVYKIYEPDFKAFGYSGGIAHIRCKGIGRIAALRARRDQP